MIGTENVVKKYISVLGPTVTLRLHFGGTLNVEGTYQHQYFGYGGSI